MTDSEKFNMIEVRNLIVKYKKYIAVDNVSFDVSPGEIFGLLGPNGAGKTSIIKALTTLNRNCEGIAKICNVDVLKRPFAVRKLICLVSQHNSLDVFLNVFDNLYYYAWLQKVPRRMRKQKVLTLLDIFGLLEKRNKLVTSLSGGQYRRLQLAKIFLADAKVYFLDEPSIGLDVQVKEIFWRFLKETCKETGVTIILATNDLVEAERVCDRIGFLNNGKMATLGTPFELERMLNKVVVDVQFDKLYGDALGLIQKNNFTNANVENQVGNIIQFRYFGNGSPLVDFIRDIECIGKIHSISMRQPNLQDVFLELVKNEKKERVS